MKWHNAVRQNVSIACCMYRLVRSCLTLPSQDYPVNTSVDCRHTQAQDPVVPYLLTYWIACLLTYLLTPWSRVPLEKLIVSQLVKKFPAFYGIRRFITAFTSASHLPLSWASSIQFMPVHPASWRSILILSFRLRLVLPSGLFPRGFPTKTLYTPLLSPYALHAPPISFFSIWSLEQNWVRSTDH